MNTVILKEQTKKIFTHQTAWNQIYTMWKIWWPQRNMPIVIILTFTTSEFQPVLNQFENQSINEIKSLM